jgi:hypothetical protein
VVAPRFEALEGSDVNVRDPRDEGFRDEDEVDVVVLASLPLPVEGRMGFTGEGKAVEGVISASRTARAS